MSSVSPVSRSAHAPLLLALLLLAGCATVPLRHVEEQPGFRTRVTTEDGWSLAVFGAAPDPGTAQLPHHGTPVLLIHGTSVNRFNYMTDGSDLVAYLASRGFDVWVPEYRGDRSSRAPDTATWRSGDWSVDDIAAFDVTATMDLVLRESGRDQLYWIGHSLGGALGYITAEGPRSHQIAGLVTIGAPGAFPHPNRLAQRAEKHTGLLPRAGQVPTRGAAKAVLPLLDFAPDDPLLHAVYNLDNVDVPTLADFVGAGMENIGRGMTEQYLRWMTTGRVTSLDGSVDYTAGLGRIEQPALVVAGRVDHIVPPWAARAGYDGIASEDKTWRVMGQSWGERHDYGHGDLLVGDFVVDELFPDIADWIEARVRARLPPAAAPVQAGEGSATPLPSPAPG